MKICANKKCLQAGVLQPMENFNKDAHTPDGKQRRCRACEREYDEKQKARTKKSLIFTANLALYELRTY